MMQYIPRIDGEILKYVEIKYLKIKTRKIRNIRVKRIFSVIVTII